MSLLDSALSLGSSILGFFSARDSSSRVAAGQEEMNALNLQIAREQMAFQERMYKHRHQYEVEDLRKAGLNPILSAGGQPPVPAGASATMLNPEKDAQLLKTARMQAISNIALNASQVAKNISDKKKAEADASLTAANARTAAVQADFWDSPYGRNLNAVRQTIQSVAGLLNIGGLIYGAGKATRALKTASKASFARGAMYGFEKGRR